jgi:hypothetical protein
MSRSDHTPFGISHLPRRAFAVFCRRLELPFDHAFYLSLFRVFLAAHIIKKLATYWPYARLLYSGEAFIATGSLLRRLGLGDGTRHHYYAILAAYLLAAVFMALGVGRRLTVLAVFLLTLVVQEMQPYTLNGGDNFLKFILLYFILCDSFEHLCLAPRRPRAPWRVDLDRALTRIGVGLILGHLALIYAVSAAGKFHADVWYEGVANYYVLSLERFHGPGSAWITGHPAMVVGTTYFTLFWEATFPFFIWHRRLRWFSLAAGIAIHSGIYVVMMLHDFELLFLATYGLLLTDAEWRTAAGWARRAIESLPFPQARPARRTPSLL